MKLNLIPQSSLLKFLLVIALCISFNNKSQASHAMGADFIYECLGGNQYALKLTFYRDCSGINAPASMPVALNSASCGLTFNYTLPQVSFQEISSTCPTALSTCQGGTEPGVEEYIYIDTVTIANQCSDWIFSFPHCCRNPSINNLLSPSSENLYIESFLNNTGGVCNSSPVFSALGVPYVCDGILSNYNFAAFDPDGDSLTFSLVNSLGAAGVPIGYQVPYSPTYPIITTTGTVDFDTTNGQMSFTPLGLQVCVVTVLVEEYRAGVLIGSVMRDIQVLIINCAGNTPPELSSGGMINVINGTLIDTAHVELCIGDSLQFDLVFDDINTLDTLTLTSNVTVAFPTATLISTGINPVTGTFSWTPGVGDVGLHNLFVSVADDNCPITGMQGYAFLINVLAGTYAGPDINLCLGDTVQMQGDGGASFQWTPSTGLANDTLANTLAYPTVTTTYMLTSNFSGTCDTIDSMTINVVPAFTATFSSNQTICQGASVQLSASGSPAAAYSFQWSPGTGLDSTQVATPTASPTATTTYNVTITSPGSCMQLGSVVVTVDTAILNITPLASSNYICPGDNVTLYANVNASTSYTITWQDQDSVIVGNTDSIIVSPSTDMTYTAIITNGVCMEIASVDVTVSMLDIGADTISLCTGGSFPVNPVYAPIGSVPPTACGISTGCSGSGGITPYTVGNGTAVNSSTAYPAPFGNWYKNAKHQILYTAADLLAAGLTAGTITEIGFTVNTIIGTTLYSAYELKLGCTSVSSLSTWEAGLNQVFSPTDVTITVGLNTLVLTSPFDWDGTSNLIMEICFDNLSTAYTNNSSSPYTVTGYNSVLYYRSDVTPACPFTGAATISVNRPNTTFTVCTEMFDPTFLWTPSAGVSNDTIANAILTPPASTVYKLTMNNGLCIITDSVYMALSDILGLSGTTQDATCGSADGTATVTIGGGTAPFAYLWNDVSAQTTGTAIGLGVGSYTVSITDSNGCTESLILSVSEAGGPSLTTTALDLNCSGGSAGEATVNATAGAPPYTYLWDDVSAQTNATATGLPAGTYTVIVTGSDNCMASTTVTITEPAPLSVVKSNTEPTCFGDCDGSATLTVNGGTAPFMYLWDDPSAQTNALASGLCDGTYQAIYTDANGCMDSTNVTITEPIDVVASITGTVQNICLGGCIGTATVGVVSGGVPPFAYLWDDPAAQTTATATGLCAGSYIGSVVDLNGCTSNSVAVITEPGGTNTTMSAIDATCGGTDGSANVVATGGVAPYTYSWNDPASQTNATATAIGFGVYTVIVTDFNGCTTVDSVSVNNIGAPSLTAVVDNNVSCFGNFDGAATATATTGSPPITYLWNDPATQTNATANGLGSGSYTVTASDINGCSASAFLTITEPAQLTSTIAVTDILCNGDCDGSATLTVSGGTAPFMYLWDDPSAQTNALASGLCANAYVGTVTDNNGCILTVTDTVNEPGLLVVTSTSVNELCSAGDGQGTAAVSGGVSPYAYLWSDPAAQTSATAVNLSAGAYAVAVTDGNNCTTIDSVTIANTGVSIASLTGINPGCGACDGSVTVVASGGTGPYTYLWNDPAPQTSSTASSLCQGTYTVMVTDTNGCTKTDSTTLIQPPLFTVSSSTQNLVCGGVCDGTASLTITGGTPPYTYLWDDPAAQTNAIATDLCANTFTCNISDTAGCSAVETVTITEPGALVVSVITIPASPGGSDGSATASTVGGTGPMAFLWDDSGAQTTATATGLSTGTYNVTVTDANGCTVTEIASISDGTGIWDYQLGVRFEVYPNPTTGVVVFDLELLEVSGITIQILDIVGGLVYQTAHTSVHLFKRETDLSALANGIYLVRLSTEKGSVERRIVIAK